MNLVGGFNPSKKYEFVSWDDDMTPIYGKIKAMFQTTKQRINGAHPIPNQQILSPNICCTWMCIPGIDDLII